MGYTDEQARRFIAEIAPAAQKAFRELGKVLPSVCIGMAMVESAAGTSNIMRSNNAFLGHKVGTGKTATKYWGGKFFVARTSEEYRIGEHTIIRDAFRSFDSMEQCVFNFYELLTTSSLYKRVMSGVDYKTQMSQIKACGYMTSSTEVNTVIKLIEKYNLTLYDSKQEVPLHIQKRRVLKKGMSGSDVVYMQRVLQNLGYDIGKTGCDGILGNMTSQALLQFQKEHFVDPKDWDSICGVRTWAMLEQYA